MTTATATATATTTTATATATTTATPTPTATTATVIDATSATHVRIINGVPELTCWEQVRIEVNHAQMCPRRRREIRRMSGGSGRYDIEYYNGRTVVIRPITDQDRAQAAATPAVAPAQHDDSPMQGGDSPVQQDAVQQTEPLKAAEAPRNVRTHTGAVHAPGRYSKRLRTHRPACCASESALARFHYLIPTSDPVTCRRCIAHLAKQAAKQ